MFRINKVATILILGLLVSSNSAFGQVRSDSLTVANMRSLGVDFTTNNRVTLLESGEKKFEDMFSAIRQAKHSIHLEYFNFRNDSIGNLLFDLLAEKSSQGVEVRALFDGFGNSSNSRPIKKRHLRKIRETGGEIYEFDPMRFPWINHAFHRDHRKIVVIDGVIAYTGGMNVADYYTTGRPEFGDWRDMHARIEGEAVAALQRIFITMWNKISGQNISGTAYYPGFRMPDESFVGLSPDTTATAGEKMLAIFDRVPYDSPAAIRTLYNTSISNAQHHIQIVNPYLTLMKSVRRSIEQAIDRGVIVEIMVSTKSDISITPDVVAYNVNKLMKRGAHVYYYDGGFHHTKVMMVDSLFCTIGSANLNSRSLAYDYETNALIIDESTTAQLSKMFESDKEFCTYFTSEEWKKLPRRKRFAAWFYHFLGPLI